MTGAQGRLAGRVAVIVGAGQTAGTTVGNGRAFLASDEAAFITGILLLVDGGQAARIG